MNFNTHCRKMDIRMSHFYLHSYIYQGHIIAEKKINNNTTLALS